MNSPIEYAQAGWNGASAAAALPAGLKKFFKMDDKINQVFCQNIFDYNRDCNQISDLPSMSIFLHKSTGNSQSYNEKGMCKIIVTLPLELLFEDKAVAAQEIANIITLRLKTSNIIYDLEPYCPGLVRLGFKYDIDYSTFEKKRSQDAYVLKYNIDYEVNMMKLWEYILDHGYSVQDPSEYKYPIITSYDLNIDHDEPE